jgi:hypothetical protein
METRERISPGYKPGDMTKETAATLSHRLWEMLRKQADSEVLELLDLHNSMEAIAMGLYEEDTLADPLGNIVKVLQFLDGINEGDPDGAPEPAKA